MDKNSFLFYLDYEEQFNLLSDEQIGQLMRAIIKYEKTKKEPNLDGMLKMAFSFIKTQLDRDREKYEKKCEKNKENGALGGRPKKKQTDNKKPNGFSKNRTKPKKADNDNEDDDDDDNEDDNNNTASEDKSSSASVKANKHKYGKYKHVLLKDEELQSLKEDYQNWNELIEYLDEYIEMKGYKAKSHYLCIKKWVVDAVKRNGKPKKESNFEQRNYDDLSYLYANGGN